MVQFNAKPQDYNVVIYPFVSKNNENLDLYAHFQTVIQLATP